MAHLFTCEGEGCTILSSSCYKSYSSSFTQQAPFHRIPFSGVHLYEWKKLTITGNSNVNHFHKSICRKKKCPISSLDKPRGQDLPWTAIYPICHHISGVCSFVINIFITRTSEQSQSLTRVLEQHF